MHFCLEGGMRKEEGISLGGFSFWLFIGARWGGVGLRRVKAGREGEVVTYTWDLVHLRRVFL